MDDYLEAFVREGEEHVTELNNALLTLESDPNEEAAMDRIFRTAHTLKGNFGAMGFEAASDLSHAIEDLLDAMRQGEIAVTSDRMDKVFAGVDAIETCLSEIDESGAVSQDVRPVIEDLRAVLEGEHEPNTHAQADSDGDTVFDPDALGVTDRRVVAADIEIADTEMPGVDAMFVLEDLESAFDLLATAPDREEIEGGEYGETFSVALGTDAGDVAGEIEANGKVTAVSVRELETGGAATQSTESDAETEATTPTDADTPDSGAERGDVATAGAEESPEQSDESPEQSEKSPGQSEESPEQSEESAESDDATTATEGDAGESADDGSTPADDSVGEIQSVRVDVEQLDELHGLVEQLVTTRIKLRRSVEGEDRGTEEELDDLDKITSNLQDTVMDMRLVPMGKIVGKFPRLVRDLAREEDKQVDFEIEGEDVEIDRTILTEISDPLMHVLRNAVDHGIEPPAEREAAGKDPTGTITLSAERERDRVKIRVEDDGRGVDHEAVRAKAVEQGIVSEREAAELTDEAVAELIFHSGFSTSEEVTDVSGRGVGMDVVNDTVSRLDGDVSVQSTEGEGTTVTLTLPVTVAIVKVLFVESGGEEYGIPIKTVDEISRMRTPKRVDGEEVVTYDDTVYPLVRLGEALEVPGPTENGDGMLVKIRETERQVAIHCDEVRGQEEVVVKPFEGILSGIPGLSGAAVLGEGDVVTILDVATL
jgi:two-component system chemotaxis sensor kinase CheA